MSVQQFDGTVTKSTPADPAGTVPKQRKKRIPMSVARRKLEVVQEIPGFHLHFFRDDKVQQALDAGYEFVNRREVTLNVNNPGSLPHQDGNTALDSHVSVVGGHSEKGDPIGLTLMKIETAYYEEDQKLLEDQNINRMRDIFVNEMIVGKDGRMSKDATAYVKTAVFNRPIRKAGPQARRTFST